MLSLDDQSDLIRKLKTATLEKWSRSEASTAKARLFEAVRAGDRLGIIEAVSQVLPEYELQAHYEGKDEKRAIELLKRDEPTEALAWAPPTSKLYDEILYRRIRDYYASGELARCHRDCRYLAERRQQQPVHEDQQERRAQIEALLIHANCSKAVGDPPEVSRGLLNEAMRRINELALGSNSSEEKARLLRSCKSAIPPVQLLQVGKERQYCHSKPVPGQLLGKPHQVLSCCSDALALSHDRTRGRYLYATRNIKPGSVLIVDRPYSFSTDLSALRTNCTNCHLSFRLADVTQIPCKACSTVRYCSEECSQQAWDRFHKYECQIFKYLYESDLQKCNAPLAYRTVVTACLRLERDQLIVNEDFVRLHKHDDDKGNQKQQQKNYLTKKYEPDDYQTVFNLETHCADQQLDESLENAIYSTFLASCLIYSLGQLGLNLNCSGKLESVLAASFLHSIQAIKCNAYEIVENVRNEETKVFEPRNVGGAIYTSVSLTNHSCYPNVVRHCFPDGVVAVTALRFIPKGAEILDCYGQHFLENPRDHRRRHLKMKYYFECNCEACTFDWPTKLPQQQNDDIRFKCKRCSKPCRKLHNAVECKECGQKTAICKLIDSLRNSTEQKRITALTKMYDGCYSEALPLLLEHSNFIEKILLEPSLEAVKTQQSIIQCLNAMSCTSY